MIIGGFVVLGIVWFICFIKVLIALFKNAGVGLGILGIFCGPFTYVWGWVKSGALKLKITMIVWTLSFVGIMGLYGKVVADLVTNPGMQKLIQDAQKQALDAQKQAQEAAQQPAVPAPAVPAPAVPATN